MSMTESEAERETKIRDVRTRMVENLERLNGNKMLGVPERRALASYIGHKSDSVRSPLHFYASDSDFHQWDEIEAKMLHFTGPHAWTIFKIACARANVSVHEP